MRQLTFVAINRYGLHYLSFPFSNSECGNYYVVDEEVLGKSQLLAFSPKLGRLNASYSSGDSHHVCLFVCCMFPVCCVCFFDQVI